MKTQDFGWDQCQYFGRVGPRAPWVGFDGAKKNYQKNRLNGGDVDRPGRAIPLDGRFSNWIKCPNSETLPRLQADGSYKEGWAGRGNYSIRYQEGPGDKAWMEERDGNYLNRLEREGKVEEAGRLRASLPTSHPHYRPMTAPPPAAPSVTRAATTERSRGQGGASAAAPSPAPAPSPPPPAPDPLAPAFEAQSRGEHRQAITLLDAYLADYPESAKAHQYRANSYYALANTVSSRAQKIALLEAAQADYRIVLAASPANDSAGAAVDRIDAMLAELAPPVAAAGAGTSAPAPAMTLFQAVGHVWSGKYATDGAQPTYVPHAKKTEGCAIGAIYRKTPSKPGASHAGKLWLGKVGFNQSERDERALRTHSLVRRGSSVDSIREKVAADTYALLSRGQYLVPKHRLAKLPVINEFTSANVLAQTLVEEMNQGRTERREDAVHLMSKWIDGYHNLDTAQVKNPDGSTGPIMAYVEAQHTLPEQIVVDGREIPLLGVMEILAAARLLGDTDVLGGGGKNAGYVIERDSAGTPVAARAVKIDAGNAFNFHGAENRLFQSFNPMSPRSSRSAHPCDIQFGNNQPLDIEWAKLSENQQTRFLVALRHGLDLLQTASTLRILINREGEFNRAEAGLLSESVVTTLIEVWQANLTMQASDHLYGPMLAELRTSASPSP